MGVWESVSATQISSNVSERPQNRVWGSSLAPTSVPSSVGSVLFLGRSNTPENPAAWLKAAGQAVKGSCLCHLVGHTCVSWTRGAELLGPLGWAMHHDVRPSQRVMFPRQGVDFLMSWPMRWEAGDSGMNMVANTLNHGLSQKLNGTSTHSDAAPWASVV